MFQFSKKIATVRGKAPEAYLYEPEKKDKKVTDKELFIMKGKAELKKSK